MTLLDIENSKLSEKIYNQIKYYFSDYNLSRDKYLKSQIEQSEDKSVKIETLATFKRLKELCSDINKIAILLSDHIKTNNITDPIIIVDVEKLTIKRNIDLYPLPNDLSHFTEILSKTNNVYVKGFPKNISLEELTHFFESSYGPVINIFKRCYILGDKKANQLMSNSASCSNESETKESVDSLEAMGFMGKTKNGIKFFKGSVFVTFKNASDAEKFVNLPSVKYDNIELTKSYQHVYENKKGIIDKKQKTRSFDTNGNNQGNELPGDEDELIKSRVSQLIQRGNILHLIGFDQKDGKIDRHKIKETFDNYGKIAWIDFEPGNVEAFIRFTGQDNVAKTVLEKLNAIKNEENVSESDNQEIQKFDWKINLSDGFPAEIKARILEGDEEFKYWIDIVKQILKSGSNDKNFNRKKKGNFNKKQHNYRNKRKPENSAIGGNKTLKTEES